MAKRYSGDVSGRVTYRDPSPGSHLRNGDYKVSLSSGGKRKVIYVGAPAYLSHAVDSAKAYDEAFRAAMSFADDMGFDMQFDLAPNGAVRVSRSRPKKR